ncbi:MAG: hypothetical protein KY410_01455 [Proteobacteria bacterium]|nr:hypothetical protein [Pseudomonadota bacterium]
MKHVLEFVLLSTVVACSTAFAAEMVNAPVDDLARVHETVAISRLAAAPDMEEFAQAMEAGVDPAPDLARVDRLVSCTPVDGVPASQRTVVYLGFDEANIHAVFLSFDDEPDLIRSSRGARDQLADDDDSVALHLGPVANAQHLYGFQTNLPGVSVGERDINMKRARDIWKPFTYWATHACHGIGKDAQASVDSKYVSVHGVAGKSLSAFPVREPAWVRGPESRNGIKRRAL